MPARRGIHRLVGSALLAALVLVGVVDPGPAAGAAYDKFYANFQGEELMRAINADRGALGLSALRPDPTLAAVARNEAYACPSNGSLTIRGRVRDMADRGYLSHTVKDCKTTSGANFDAFDLAAALGVSWTGIGETIGSNNYPSSKQSYATGCNSSGGSCSGSIQLPWSVAVAERGWMSSAAHRPLVLGSWDRFGCAAWNSSGGNHYYSCYFVSGGSAHIDSTGPTVSSMSGVGQTFPVGSTPTFTATAADSASLLADGRASIDGDVIREWAHDHDGASEPISAVAPPLTSGTHTFSWWVRDTSTNTRTVSFTFSVGSAPPPTPSPTQTGTPTPVPPTPGPTAPPTATPAPPAPTATPAPVPTPTGAATSPTATPAGQASAPAGTPSTAASPGQPPSSTGPTSSAPDGLAASPTAAATASLAPQPDVALDATAAPASGAAASSAPASAGPGAAADGAAAALGGREAPRDPMVVGGVMLALLGLGLLAIRSRPPGTRRPGRDSASGPPPGG